MYKKRYGNNKRNHFNPQHTNSRVSFGVNRTHRNTKFFNPQDLVKKADESHVEAVYTPTHTFQTFALDERLKNAIANKGYTTVTPIQDQAIPAILEGRDVIGIANTGTGKTAAFLIPTINTLLQDRSKRALIIAPTRELAFQIQEEFWSFAKSLSLYVTLCIGGTSLYHQQKQLRNRPSVVIATPGRLRDLIQQKALNLSDFSIVVLDEADHMVDIGFINDIKYFISLLPKNRQSLFFSATIDGKVSEILRTFVSNPVTISVKKRETAQNVDQDIIKILDKKQKVEILHDLLIKKEFEKVLVFGRTKWGVQKLSDELNRRGFKAGAIHGNKRQNQRLQTLEQFKKNRISVLLATDVASRGLDIQNVTHVINYDMPATYEDYIHRIGRTGRASQKGTAITFVE